MKKLLFAYFLLLLTLSADILYLEETTDTITTSKYQITIEDKEHNLTSTNILNGEYKDFSTNITQGYSHSDFWTKTTIVNHSQKDTGYIFRNLRAGVDKIDVFIYDKSTLLSTHLLGDKREQKQKDILSAKSVFVLEIQRNQQLTIVTKYSSLGSFDLFWQIMQVEKYSYINGIDNIVFGLFGGFIFLLIVYNLILYFSLKEKMFLFYTLQIFFAWWFIYAVSGVFYFLNIGFGLDFLTATTWFAPILMVFFSVLFIIEFFQLYKTNKMFYYALSLFLVVSVGYFILYFYGYLYDETIFVDHSYTYLNISFLSYIVIFSTAIWAVYKNFEGALYIALGEMVYILSIIFITFILKGDMVFSSYSYLIMPVAVLLQMMLYSLALSKKIQKIKSELEDAKLLLIQNKHYIEYGKMAGNISHQWKQPLSHLSSQIMYLSMLKTLNQEEKIKDEFLKMAPQLNYTVELMSNTINVFNNIYSHSLDATTINIKNTIEQLIELYDYKIILNNITIEYESLDENIELLVHKDSFLQIFIILLDNSIDQFEKLNNQKKQNNQITIKTIASDDFVKIEFQDNAGGIKLPLSEIFKSNVTTKKGKSGIGLYILETILEQKIYGHKEVQNTKDGAKFTLFIPKKLKL